MNPDAEDPLMSGVRRRGPAPRAAGDVINDVVERAPIP